MNVLDFCVKIYNEITKRLKSDNVKFQPQKDQIYVELALRYEVQTFKDFLQKILDMVDHFPQNLIMIGTKKFKQGSEWFAHKGKYYDY